MSEEQKSGSDKECACESCEDLIEIVKAGQAEVARLREIIAHNERVISAVASALSSASGSIGLRAVIK